jgi:aldose 1-epimerase
VRFASWTGQQATDGRVEMTHELWPSPGYPFHLELRVAYELTEDGLTVISTARNVGTEAAPFGAGQHPYLRPPGGVRVDACGLVVPAAEYLETDERGLPRRNCPVEGSPFDFRRGRTIGAATLDTPFTGLERDGDGRAFATLGGDGRTATMWVDEGYRWLQVFTADTVPAPRTRAAIAIEPMTCPPNAFASGTDVIRLEPEQTWTASWGIRLDPG